jgi:hypothetical protein
VPELVEEMCGYVNEHWTEPTNAIDALDAADIAYGEGRIDSTRSGLALVILRERSTLTSFHATPPGSPSLLQVSHSKEIDVLNRSGAAALAA